MPTPGLDNPNPAPILLRHRLRLQLRRHRGEAELTQQQAAKQLGWSTSKLVRIEAGHVGLTRTDAKALLTLYGVTDDVTAAEQLAWAEQSRKQPRPSNDDCDILTAEQLLYIRYETVATRLRAFQLDGIHDLLQTAQYTRCILRAVQAHMPAQAIERLVELRMRRQQLLHRPTPPTVQILLDETALLRPPSTEPHAHKVLQAQIQWLHELAELPHLDLRVVPLRRGYHPGIETPFTVVDLPAEAGSVVYSQANPATSIIRESADDTAYHHRLFEHLAASASILSRPSPYAPQRIAEDRPASQSTAHTRSTRQQDKEGDMSDIIGRGSAPGQR